MFLDVIWDWLIEFVPSWQDLWHRNALSFKAYRDFRLNRHLVLNNIKQLLFSWSCCVPTWRMWLLMSVCVWVVSRDVQQSSVCVYISCVCWPGWQSYYCLTPEGVSCQCGQALSYPKALNELAPTTKQRGLEMLCL